MRRRLMLYALAALVSTTVAVSGNYTATAADTPSDHVVSFDCC